MQEESSLQFVVQPPYIPTKDDFINEMREGLKSCTRCGRWTMTMYSFDQGTTRECSHCVYKLMERPCPCGECYAEREFQRNQEEVRKYNEGFGNFVQVPECETCPERGDHNT